MNATLTAPAPFDLDRLNVRALEQDELVGITGGTDPVSIGCFLAVAGVGVAVVGVVVGIAVYALVN